MLEYIFIVCFLGCRQVFERWMEWEPDEQAWHSYINFELRCKELDRARALYERYILLCIDSYYLCPCLRFISIFF